MALPARLEIVGIDKSPNAWIGGREVIIEFDIITDPAQVGTCGLYYIDLLDLQGNILREFPCCLGFVLFTGINAISETVTICEGLRANAIITSNWDPKWSLNEVQNGFYLVLYEGIGPNAGFAVFDEVIKHDIIEVGANCFIDGSNPINCGVTRIQSMDEVPQLIENTGGDEPNNQGRLPDATAPNSRVTKTSTTEEFNDKLGGFSKAVGAVAKVIKWVLIGGAVALVGYGIFLASKTIRRK